ncbi:EAL domain-containing protein [Pseudoduganella sp. DS3]|uniref:EAL domain-containing protein n=1 Tax=Pseudoduganella guangdongensis TaxID=2692179 RepID=A0A6N9HD34_9BURK|nr:EAL domain-containing protein [Pseudoduganella guangdongensis]MYN01157.1 EAL domain-containing protein [Pseudoduganella guangdongensis]
MTNLLGVKNCSEELKQVSREGLLEQTTRALRTLSAGIRTLLRAKEEAALLQDMCKAIVDTGGYRRAGVAFAEDDEAKKIRWVNWVGASEHKSECKDLDWFNSKGFTYNDTPIGQTAAGVAIRTCEPCVRRDILNNPLYASEQFTIFRQHARAEGYASLTAYPLISNDIVFGALLIAASEPDAFDKEELSLLAEMADDLAFGIAGLRLREQHRQAQETIYRQAFFDGMTGLGNRTRQMDLLEEYFARFELNARPLSLIHINIGRFSEVCHVFGQQLADQLILEIVRNLKSRLPENLELARVSEATLSVIVPECTQQDAVAFAHWLISGLSDAIEVADIVIDAHLHAGVVTSCKEAHSAEILFQRANAALFHGNFVSERVTSFASGRNVEHMSRLSLMGDLRLAIKRDELRVFCQAKVDMKTRKIAGAEALIRWQHPTLGMVSPAYFIPLAEQSGFIVELTKWMLESCFSWLHRWKNNDIRETLAINLSPYDLLSSSIVCDIGKRMEQWKICSESVEFELTENALVQNPRVALDVLKRLKELGVKLLLDDFGTGYSSLSYLQQFPFDAIKIDQSFIRPMLENSDSAAIVHSTIELGHILGKRVVAEGIESQEIWECLREQDCDFAQGYLVSKPIPIEDFQQWKASWTAEHR